MNASSGLSEPPVSISTVRAALASGDSRRARAAFDNLSVPSKPTADIGLVEASLLEAEGNPQGAIMRLENVLNAFPTSPKVILSANLHIARLAMALNLPLKAEASARSILAIDPGDLTALKALEFVHNDRGEAEPRFALLRQIALSPMAAETDVWRAVSLLADAQRWVDVRMILDHREFELDPWKLSPARLKALVGQEWRERALAQLLKDYSDGYIGPKDAIELLIGQGALAVAASFVVEALATDPWRPWADAMVGSAIDTTLTNCNLRDEPIKFVDAVQARDLLRPGRSGRSEDLAAARAHLIAEARRHLDVNEPLAASTLLIAATRILPADQDTMALLAEAARLADLKERYLDTLMRIWRDHHDTDALIATARGILDTSSWPLIAEVMAVAVSEAASIGIDVDALIKSFRLQACRKLDECIFAGDIGGGLELVTALSGQFPLSEWPTELISRLLRAAKRRLRAQKSGADAQLTSLGALYLQVEPADHDVQRILARALMRQKRAGEARDLLSRVLRANPHAPSDWVSLAMAHHELGNLNERAYCTVRALIISPGITLPAPLVQVRAGIEAA